MESVTVLLRELAEKLGTTTEYLWGVLVKQAPISSISNLFMVGLTILFSFGLWKLHKWLMGNYADTKYSRYDEYEEAAIIPMVFLFIIIGVFIIAGFFTIPSIITGFLNPEYWALKEILSNVK
jgi:hypothetical protein